jgi:hypothetical protein
MPHVQESTWYGKVTSYSAVVGKAKVALPLDVTDEQSVSILQDELLLLQRASDIAECAEKPMYENGVLVTPERWTAMIALALRNGVQSARTWQESGPFGTEYHAEVDGQRVSDLLYAQAAIAVCAYNAARQD